MKTKANIRISKRFQNKAFKLICYVSRGKCNKKKGRNKGGDWHCKMLWKWFTNRQLKIIYDVDVGKSLAGKIDQSSTNFESYSNIKNPELFESDLSLAKLEKAFTTLKPNKVKVWMKLMST